MTISKDPENNVILSYDIWVLLCKLYISHACQGVLDCILTLDFVLNYDLCGWGLENPMTSSWLCTVPLTTEVPDIEEQSKQEFTQEGEGKDPSLKDFR